MIESPVHACNEEAEMEGAGELFTLTVTGLETSEHPSVLVTVTV